MSLFRKHSTILTLCSVLCMAIAAPYLVPENPDSAVFRSGTLGLLLMLGCFFPAREALARANRRTLVSGLVYGFLFAVALGLGSELFVYDGLLRGMSSALRRAAVPVLATPLLGALVARALMTHVPRARRAMRIPLLAYAAVLFLCWLPLLLAFYPGMINYDFPQEYQQHIDQVYSNIHPLLHSALVNGLITLGEWISSRTFGLLLVSLMQMVCFALALAYALVFAQRRGAPACALGGLTALFALHPVFSVMSVSTTKDTLFAAAVLVFTLETWGLLESPRAFFRNRWRCAAYSLLAIGVALLRNNGLFVLLLALPAVVVALRGLRKQAATLAACCVIAPCLVQLGLTLALSPKPLPSFQLYSIPAQQVVRAYNSGTMSDEDKAEIESWYTAERGLIVRPHLADGAKDYLDPLRLEQEGGDFLRIWRKHAGTYLHTYIEAFLMLNVGSWYPDDLSHAVIYIEGKDENRGYLQLQDFEMTAQGLHTTSLLPAVRDLYERICRRNIYRKYPLIPVLFCTATPFWLLLLACAKLVADRRRSMLPAALGLLGLWLSYLFGPCSLPRYTLPLFCAAPMLWLLAWLPAPIPSDGGFDA